MVAFLWRLIWSLFFMFMGSILKPHGVDFFGLELFMIGPIFLFQQKIKGAFSKPLFFMVLGIDIFYACLVYPGSHFDVDILSLCTLSSWIGLLCFYIRILGFLRLVLLRWTCLLYMEVEMEVAGRDLSPIKVESDVVGYT